MLFPEVPLFHRPLSIDRQFVKRLDGFLPLWESIDLQDYRNWYASHSRDEALQNLMRRILIMAIWDDHELSNDALGDKSRCVCRCVQNRTVQVQHFLSNPQQ